MDDADAVGVDGGGDDPAGAVDAARAAAGQVTGRRRSGVDRLLPHLDTEGEAALERDAETKI
ncbi:hypothetical protein OG342_38755 [Streptomyces bobili]|uniref:hypothetical protein n=1 Tax=Streptomyces bobili TaxID=67280 RepID=UPI002251EF89|nr:hypothetical protein [Streptomyces bobili]MCX5528726.1 hypothetical protein [Streptomyces bobili]